MLLFLMTRGMFDYRSGRPMELHAIFKNPIEAAARVGTSAAVCQHAAQAIEVFRCETSQVKP